jgi:hypothetical protein
MKKTRKKKENNHGPHGQKKRTGKNVSLKVCEVRVVLPQAAL